MYCVVVLESFRHSVLEEVRSMCYGGHFSERKVYDRLRRLVWWCGMKADVRRLFRVC